MTKIIYPPLPETIYRDEILDALESVGLPIGWIISIHLERSQIEVKFMLKDENGKAFYGGNEEVASMTVRLPVTDRVLAQDEERKVA